MKKSALSILFILSLCLVLCSCGAMANNPAAPATAEPTAEPTPSPEPTFNILGSKVTQTEVEKGYVFDLFGQQVNTAETERLEYKKVPIGDDGLAQIREILPAMKKLSYLSFDRCDTSDEAVAKLRDDFPDINIVWRVFVGPFAVMSDIETLWGACEITDETSGNLKYLTNMKNLDVGHCPITNIDFLYNMPELDTLILSCGDLSDITAVASLKKIKYLELAECRISDISPVAECTTVEHLNIGGNQEITDFTPIEGLKNLKRLNGEEIYNIEINMTDIENHFKELMPDTEVSFAWVNCLNGGNWRFKIGNYEGGYVPEYQRIRDIFGYSLGEEAKPYAYFLD